MKTSTLVFLVLGFFIGFGAAFGLIPPLLNANNSLLNALGVGCVLLVFIGIIAGFNELLTKSTKSLKEKQ